MTSLRTVLYIQVDEFVGTVMARVSLIFESSSIGLNCQLIQRRDERQGRRTYIITVAREIIAVRTEDCTPLWAGDLTHDGSPELVAFSVDVAMILRPALYFTGEVVGVLKIGEQLINLPLREKSGR
jgi:hypothetical protein